MINKRIARWVMLALLGVGAAMIGSKSGMPGKHRWLPSLLQALRFRIWMGEFGRATHGRGASC